MKVIEERIYYPDGADPDHWNDQNFAVGVYWRGGGKWMIAAGREGHRQMTRTGRWLFCPLKMTAMRWCRFTFDEACRLAEENVNAYRVNGSTWAEWQEHFAKRASA